jgi:CDP-2,3-bis-(O-geranylgeranyl)-sn-glycerol synthase
MWLTHEQLLILLLLLIANGAPLLTGKLLRQYNHPLDGESNFIDGRPLFGPSKTMRGILAALVATPLASMALGLGWLPGLLIGLFAMIGDLFSSFLKRRLNMPSGSRASGLDHIPESLFPLLACSTVVELPAFQIFLLVALFFSGGFLLSRIARWLGIREHP